MFVTTGSFSSSPYCMPDIRQALVLPFLGVLGGLGGSKDVD